MLFPPEIRKKIIARDSVREGSVLCVYFNFSLTEPFAAEKLTCFRQSSVYLILSGHRSKQTE